jgi:hypothetical protein
MKCSVELLADDDVPFLRLMLFEAAIWLPSDPRSVARGA